MLKSTKEIDNGTIDFQRNCRIRIAVGKSFISSRQMKRHYG